MTLCPPVEVAKPYRMTPIIATCIVILLCTIAITLAGVLILLACIYSVLLRIRERMR